MAGPIPSSFGVHFVFIDERTKGGIPRSIRWEAVQREWLNERRVEAEQKLYRTLRDRYQIVVEMPPKAATSEARMRSLAISWVFGRAAVSRAAGRNPAGLSGTASDGVRHIQPAIQDTCARR